MVDFTADQRHAAVMAALLKSMVWLILPTLLHLILGGRPIGWLGHISSVLALLQLFWGWRCIFDGYLFEQLATGRTDEQSLDQMLVWLFKRPERSNQMMLVRLQGARRLVGQFVLLTLAYWSLQYAA